jgi:hypothetical protein
LGGDDDDDVNDNDVEDDNILFSEETLNIIHTLIWPIHLSKTDLRSR